MTLSVTNCFFYRLLLNSMLYYWIIWICYSATTDVLYTKDESVMCKYRPLKCCAVHKCSTVVDVFFQYSPPCVNRAVIDEHNAAMFYHQIFFFFHSSSNWIHMNCSCLCCDMLLLLGYRALFPGNDLYFSSRQEQQIRLENSPLLHL